MRPCTQYFRLLVSESNSGAPLLSRPQRTIISSKPSSQPKPLGSCRFTNFGCTGPRTGDCQPNFTSPIVADARLIPLVNNRSNCNFPLLTCNTSTPSLNPPRSVFLMIENLAGVSNKLSEVTASDSRCSALSVSEITHVLIVITFLF